MYPIWCIKRLERHISQRAPLAQIAAHIFVHNVNGNRKKLGYTVRKGGFVMLEKLMVKIVMAWLRKEYKKYGGVAFHINGTQKDYPRYLLYTEDELVRVKLIMTWRKI